jgi:GntR family transcriptional regulator, transcriptional repressor for pyruvate dehydrogenase complex
MTDLVSLAGPSLRERVTRLLEERVLYGDWRPGTQLPSETELCAQLGVSRSVVRDAIRSLDARGLVEVRQGVGTIVAESSADAYSDATLLMLLRSGVTVHEAVEARAAIEQAVVGIAAAARSEDDLSALRGRFEAVQRAAESNDMPLALEADLGFHLGILHATHLPVLISLLGPMQEIIWVTSLPASVIGTDSGRFGYRDYDVDLHRGILDAIEARDPGLARERMQAHFGFVSDPAYRDVHSMEFREAAKLRSVLRQEIRRRAA